VSSSRFGLIALLALVAGVYVSCSSTKKSTGPEPLPPVAPSYVYAIQTDATTLVVHWIYNDSGVQGFRVYMTQDTNAAFTLRDSASATARQVTIDSLPVNQTFYFYVTAYNTDGESSRSNLCSGSTNTSLPHAPDQLVAQAISTDSVRLTWRINGSQDHFVVQRHDSASADWTTLDSLVSGQSSQYYDVTVSASTDYFYRVGAENIAGINWSVDSAYVAVPSPGAPVAPVNLQAEVHLENNTVILTWTNVSSNVDSIMVARNLSGYPNDTLGYVGSGVTTYTDSIGADYGTYIYRLKAINAYGSTWSQTVSVNYQLCSNGVIPICVGNWWRYQVTDTTGPDFVTRRDVFHAAFFQNQDYYLFGLTQNGSTDSLYYLRNDSNLGGCAILHFPHLPSDIPQLLFKYPATAVADSYHVDGHLVEIITALPGIDKTVGSTTYHGVIIYQWYLDTNHWIQVYVKPLDVGIILEEEYTGTATQPHKVATRSLINYHVSNSP
jgi:hypothetical protein